MVFKVLDRFGKPPYNAKSKGYLLWDNWNDYSFYTLFGLIYVDENSQSHSIGSVKIAYFGQEVGSSSKRLSIGDTFNILDDDHFSLGQDDSYYAALNDLGDDVRDAILKGLRDIAKDATLYEKAINEDVTKVSLLRYISPSSVTGVYRRLALGHAPLTSYSFTFSAPPIKGSTPSMTLSFEVEPDSSPPTNIHVIIGRNGVGKTHLLNNMINALIDEDTTFKKHGEFGSGADLRKRDMFANLVNVTFSAFDDSEPKPEKKDKTERILYSYIGLKRLQTGTEKKLAPKSTIMLRNEFVKSLFACKTYSRTNRWLKAIDRLESDPNFKEAQIKSLVDIKDDEEFKEVASEIFRRLSSGHRIVLLSITRLVETLQERTLVLLDEPEAHLHPPLLAAFIRTLSELLISTNGVAIIATHSPVILQEVPKSCTWKLRRTGAHAIAERLQIESFGENVGILSGEVFGLEITHSGFYKMLVEVVNEKDDLEDVLEYFDNQLGQEAQAIVVALLANKNRE